MNERLKSILPFALLTIAGVEAIFLVSGFVNTGAKWADITLAIPSFLLMVVALISIRTDRFQAAPFITVLPTHAACILFFRYAESDPYLSGDSSLGLFLIGMWLLNLLISGVLLGFAIYQGRTRK